MNESNLQNIYGISDEQYQRFLKLNQQQQQIFIQNLNNNEQPMNQAPINGIVDLETSTSAYSGRVKVKANSGNGSTKQPEIISTEKIPYRFDNAAFIDVLVLSGITALFSIISFMIIILYAYK